MSTVKRPGPGRPQRRPGTDTGKSQSRRVTCSASEARTTHHDGQVLQSESGDHGPAPPAQCQRPGMASESESVANEQPGHLELVSVWQSRMSPTRSQPGRDLTPSTSCRRPTISFATIMRVVKPGRGNSLVRVHHCNNSLSSGRFAGPTRTRKAVTPTWTVGLDSEVTAELGTSKHCQCASALPGSLSYCLWRPGGPAQRMASRPLEPARAPRRAGPGS